MENRQTVAGRVERRFVPQADAGLRVERRDEDSPRAIAGLASVFYDGTPDTEYELWTGTFERIMPGAFDRALAEAQDVRGLFNHDPNLVLGRTVPGTMGLSKEQRGLGYVITEADTQTFRDVATHIERGDVSGSSFSFAVRAERWVDEDDREVREIDDVDLYDVGPVTFPAYESTTAGLRNADVAIAQEARARWHAERESVERNERAKLARARVVELEARA